MQDRVPLYPGRVKMTPVAGQANTYDMVRADDPTQAGTPLNKATLLKDATAALFGKTNAAVPDDILSLLSKSALAQVLPKYTKHTVLLSNLSVGAMVKLPVNGAPKEFLVVHQGLPSSIYDNSCNGTWLLMKDIYENRVWSSSDVNKYESSDINTYLNSTFLNLFDSNVKNSIKQVKIPYRQNGGSGGTDQSGANGLSCKVFLLSGCEVGWASIDNSYFPQDGAKLSYFESGTGASANNKRIANLTGLPTKWWLRSPWIPDTNFVFFVYSGGSYGSHNASDSNGVRPAFILPANYQYTYYTDDSGNIYTEQEYETTLTDVLGTKLTVGVRIGTGSYVGTGTYGPSNPNTLTFEFEPKIVCVFGPTAGSELGNPLTHYAMILTGDAGFRSDSGRTIGYFVVHQITGNTVSWYSTDSQPDSQGNIANNTYNYIAIG